MGFNKKKGISAVAVLLVLAIFNAVAYYRCLDMGRAAIRRAL